MLISINWANTDGNAWTRSKTGRQTTGDCASIVLPLRSMEYASIEPLWLSSDYNPHSGFNVLHTP